MDRKAISVVIPTYQMDGGIDFLKRSFEMLKKQTFQDFEVIITDDSLNDEVKKFSKKFKFVKYSKNDVSRGMGGNTNAGIQKATGRLIKILYQDDYLAHERSLEIISKEFKGQWLVTGCTHTNGNPHLPRWNDNIHFGVNTIGSPSVMTILNEDPLLFDTQLTWVLDCDYYKRMFLKYGLPTISNDINVVIGIGAHQTTNKLSDDLKYREAYFLRNRYS